MLPDAISTIEPGCITAINMSRLKLRLIGGIVLIFNLWLIGHYNLSGIPVLLLTFGFAIGYEKLIVSKAPKPPPQ